MGLAIPFLTNNHQQKHVQQITSEKDEFQDIGEEIIMTDEFSKILTLSQQSIMNRNVPIFSCRHSPYSIKILKAPSHPLQEWGQVLSHRQLLIRLFDFLTGEDLLVLKRCNRSLRKFATLVLLKNNNNWNLTMSLLSPYMLRETHMRQSNFSDEYEHSEDLDRTSGYFESENEQVLAENRIKLDRIITTISFQIRYFQGIMPICAALLQCFNETVSFWVLKYILFKCRYIQNDIDFYSQYLLQLQDQFRTLLPTLYQHLEKMGFQLNYFVMKWIMGLFSQDMSQQMLLILWDLLCQTDIYIFIYAIIEIFKLFEGELLNSETDAINDLFKVKLKQRLNQTNAQQLFKNTKQLYISRRLDGK